MGIFNIGEQLKRGAGTDVLEAGTSLQNFLTAQQSRRIAGETEARSAEAFKVSHATSQIALEEEQKKKQLRDIFDKTPIPIDFFSMRNNTPITLPDGQQLNMKMTDSTLKYLTDIARDIKDEQGNPILNETVPGVTTINGQYLPLMTSLINTQETIGKTASTLTIQDLQKEWQLAETELAKKPDDPARIAQRDAIQKRLTSAIQVHQGIYAGKVEELGKAVTPSGEFLTTKGYSGSFIGGLAIVTTPDGTRIPYDPKIHGERQYPPAFTFQTTAEGITPANVRTGQLGVPTGIGKPLPSEQITTQQQIGTLKETLDRVEVLYKPQYVGFVVGRVGGLKEKTIGVDAEQAQFYADLAQIQNTLVYLMSGKQINEQEYKRLQRQLPIQELPESTFKARMKGFRETLDSIIENRQKGMGGYGVQQPQQTGGQITRPKTADEYLKKFGGQ